MKRKSVIFVLDRFQLEDAITFLLKMNLNFDYMKSQKNGFYLRVSQSNFRRHYLDLYLDCKTVFSIA